MLNFISNITMKAFARKREEVVFVLLGETNFVIRMQERGLEGCAHACALTHSHTRTHTHKRTDTQTHTHTHWTLDPVLEHILTRNLSAKTSPTLSRHVQTLNDQPETPTQGRKCGKKSERKKPQCDPHSTPITRTKSPCMQVSV